MALNGVTEIAAGQSVLFIEGTAAKFPNFSAAWFGSETLPPGVVMGTYSGSGIGLSSSGDGVNVFDVRGTRVTGVAFGAATTGVTFDNAAGIGSAVPTSPEISDLSIAGVNGALLSFDGAEVGSPGVAPIPEPATVGLAAAAGLGLAGLVRRRLGRSA